MPAICCRGCGYRLDPEAPPRCPECGRAWDPDDLDSFGVLLRHPEQVRRVDFEGAAVAIRTRLFAAGILSAVEVAMAGVAGLSERRSHTVWVETEEAERAREVLAEEVASAGEPWICAACGEEVPGGFEVCWNCGAACDTDAAARPQAGALAGAAPAAAVRGGAGAQAGRDERGRRPLVRLGLGTMIVGAGLLFFGWPLEHERQRGTRPSWPVLVGGAFVVVGTTTALVASRRERRRRGRVSP